MTDQPIPPADPQLVSVGVWTIAAGADGRDALITHSEKPGVIIVAREVDHYAADIWTSAPPGKAGELIDRVTAPYSEMSVGLKLATAYRPEETHSEAQVTGVAEVYGWQLKALHFAPNDERGAEDDLEITRGDRIGRIIVSACGERLMVFLSSHDGSETVDLTSAPYAELYAY